MQKNPIGEIFVRRNFSLGEIFIKRDFSSGEIFVTDEKIRPFRPTKIRPLSYVTKIHTFDYNTFMGDSTVWVAQFNQI